MIFMDAEVDLSLDARLSNFEARLLVFLITRMNEQNEVRLSQGEIAKTFKKYPPDISKAIKTLRQAGYIKTPQQGIIVVSPDIAWRGSVNENLKTLAKS